MLDKKVTIDKLAERIKNDFVVFLCQIMDRANIKYNTKDSDSIIIDYLNFCNKWISATPRNVIYSSQLNKKIKEFDPDLTDRLHCFEGMFKEGKDINGHLSRQIYSANKADMLLNAWNIRHLHLNPLSAISDEEMKKNRSNDLLFFAICEGSVLFFDVLSHPHREGFAAIHFLEIAASNNWMDKIGFMEMQGVFGINPKITKDEDIYELTYKSHLNLAFELLGKFYMSMGISTTGNPANHSFILIKFNRHLFEVSKHLLESKDLIYKGVIPYKDKYYVQFETDGKDKLVCITP